MILVIVIIVLLIVFISLIAMPMVKLHNNYKKLVTILFPFIIILSIALLTNIIIAPINFEKEKNERSESIKAKLIDIRSAELAFKEKYKQFTDDFNVLIPFIKTDSFVIVQKTDTLIEFYNKTYREYQFKDTMLIDTLGKVSILDSLFTKNHAIDSLRYVPFGGGKEFELSAGTINKSKITVPVFEAKAKKEDFLNGMNKNLIKNSAKDLIIGSMTEAHLNGNWQ